MKKYLFILILLNSGILNATTINWSPDQKLLRIGKMVMVMEDSQCELSFDQARSLTLLPQFSQSSSANLVLGYTVSCFWVKFELDNQTGEPLVLEIAQAGLPVCDFYTIDDEGNTVLVRAGSDTYFKDRIIKNSFQVFPLLSGKHEYFIRLTTNSGPIPMNVYHREYFEEKSISQRFVYGIYLGLMFFVIMSNLFFYYSMRNNLYLAYAFMVLIFICYSMVVVDGFVVYFFPKIDMLFWYTTIPPFGITIQIIYALWFLEVKRYHPKLFRIVVWIVGIYTAWFICKFFLPFPIVQPVNTLQALISFFILGYLGYKVYKNGNRFGLFFALIYILYFLFVLAEAMYINIGKPEYILNFSYSGHATVLEALALAFLLTQRFEWEKSETEKARIEVQQQLIAKTQENEKMVREQNALLEVRVDERTKELNESLENLKQTQAKLIQSEKLASLGELTAGIAHEIQNPLNFVNNFSEISVELCQELNDEIEKLDVPTGQKSEIHELTHDLMENQKKINFHGKRADSIVKGMLQHSRRSSGTKEPVDINQLADEFLRLSYHGQRAKDKSFNTKLVTEFDSNVGKVNVLPQDFGRVILNLLTNAFYAVSEKVEKHPAGYEPTVTLKTLNHRDTVDIIIQDNGNGIPESVQSKIFQPFFTTKPTGKGTGLGLSLSYEIITAGHGGQISVESTPGEGTIFKISIPKDTTKL